MTILEAALQYRSKNLSVIPCDKSKKPLTSWLEFQSRIATEEEIKVWFNKWPDMNIGIVTGEVSNLTVLDCDSHDAVTAFRTIYKGETVTVKTPRGTHYYFQYAEGTRNTVKVMGLDLDIRSSGGYVIAPPSKNGEGSAYSFIKDFSFALDSFNSLSLYRDIVDSGFGKSTRVYKSLQESTLFEEGKYDHGLYHTALCLAKGGMPRHENIEVMLKIMSSWGENDIKWAETKVNSAMERISRKERNLADEVYEIIMSTTGNFLSTEIAKSLQLSTRADIKNLSIIMKRYCNQGLVEKYGDRNGCWRRVDTEMEFMDFVHVDQKDKFDIKLPLDIQKKTLIFPKAVIVIAGVTGFGKTTWCLNIVRDNMHKYKFYYFNAEMSPLALNTKLSYFSTPSSPEDWNMKVIPDHIWDYRNIADKIFPDDVNIIDYLEPEGEKTYNIHGIVTAIIKKLDKGIAIISTQKKPDTPLSAGGVYSAKAASLYLSLDWNRIMIFKNRYREVDKFPSHILHDFELKPGQNIVPVGGWYNEQSKKEAKTKKVYADVGIVDDRQHEDFPHEEDEE